jgi:cytochrome c peroxidase
MRPGGYVAVAWLVAWALFLAGVLLLGGCARSGSQSVPAQGLPNTIAQFKTPTLRDLADSAPYFDSGGKPNFPHVTQFYVAGSQLARRGLLRNAPREFQGMSIHQNDVAALSAFLASLTKDDR